MKCFKQPSKLNVYRKTLVTLGALIPLCIMGEANADCYFKPNYKAETITITPPESIFVPRNTPNGTVIYTSAYVSPSNETYVRCDGDNIGVKNLVGDPPINPASNSIFPIGNTGLGFRWKISSNYLAPYGVLQGYDIAVAGGVYAFELVKIGPVMEGAEVPAADVATYAAGSINPMATMNLTHRIVVTPQTCTTSDVPVLMGTQKTSGFSGINTRLLPVPFSIKLNACPMGIKSVKYRLDPNTKFDQTTSVVDLSTGSTAKGVGVQILDNSNNPTPLGVDNVSGYSPGSSNFSIPLKAAYYQTGSSVTGGSANTSLTFTMTYE
jgi:type 1 fimbria pilin